MATILDAHETARFTSDAWERSIVPALMDYIRIPARSPAFDPEWAASGHLDRAVALIESWCRSRPVPGLTVEVVRLAGLTPVILMEVPASAGGSGETVLLYGHLDKQPEMVGWSEGLGPWTPVRRGDRLYGRGAGDDGYAAFSALTALEAVARQGVAHARAVVLIEASEESGSRDLPAYVNHLAPRIGTPGLVICLDSGCGNYDQLWATTSLRGVAGGTLAVEVLTEGVHSGEASGIVPSSFRILRALLSRLEDERTGTVLPRDFHVEIPAERVAEAQRDATALGPHAAADEFPLAPGMRLMGASPAERILNGTWRPALSITGADGLPPVRDAGNVAASYRALKLSLRLPPTADAPASSARLKQLLEQDPPYGATVTFTPESAPGWNAPPTAPWLAQSVERASEAHFGKPPMFIGIGGSNPFMAMLGERFPGAQFLVTGVMGPGCQRPRTERAVDVAMARKLTAAVAQVIADHHAAVHG